MRWNLLDDPRHRRHLVRDSVTTTHPQRFPGRIVQGVIGLMAVLGVKAQATDVWVVTDRQHPVQAVPGVRVIQLDAPALIESGLAAQLPSDPQQAATAIRERLREGGADLQRRLQEAYQGVTDAWRIGVTKVPAVVVDQRFVVYGTQDIDRALSLIERYRSTLP